MEMAQSLSEGITSKTQTELTDFIFVVIKLPRKKLPRQTVKKKKKRNRHV